MAKKKFYVVWEGREKGVFDNWAEAEKSVKGHDAAKFKSFGSRTEAEAAFGQNPWKFMGGGAKTASKPAQKTPAGDAATAKKIQWEGSICVDAACSGNPGDMEYRCVETRTGREIFRQGPFAEGTNNIGEFLGLVHALAMLKKAGDERTMVYSDSRTAIAWVRNRKAKTTLEPTKRNQTVFELLARAEKWVSENTWKNRIEKWETEDWGEIPADFGRK